VAVVVGIGTPAFAAGQDASTATTTSVTTTKPSIESGRPVVFHAVVAPNKSGKSKATGTVSWSIVGQNGSSLSCAKSSSALSGGGKATCTVANGQFVSVASPYTVTATYSGDANFAGSAGSTTETVAVARTTIRIQVDSRPTSGSATTVTVTVSSGMGSPALTGDVTFAAFSSMSVKGVKANCTGPNTVPPGNQVQPLVGGQATCTIPAGWMVVASPTGGDKHPKTRWAIFASYGADGSFSQISKEFKGVARG
jgi:hypothetical protein